MKKIFITIILIFLCMFLFQIKVYALDPSPVSASTVDNVDNSICKIVGIISALLILISPIAFIIGLIMYLKYKKKDDKKRKIGKILMIINVIIFILCTLKPTTYDKPIIYIYPEKDMNVSVELSNPEKLIHSYPKYINRWNVLAKTNGELTDINTGRKLYSLYWEGNMKDSRLDMNEGFVIKGEDTTRFLEEKLEILGLNEREAEEFIIYWLPQMEKNKYNFIRFEPIEEINKYMKLNITPEPETLIRVMMKFKPMNQYKYVKEQNLVKVERKGYTVVEWGGVKF